MIGINTMLTVGCRARLADPYLFATLPNDDVAYLVTKVLEEASGTSFAALNDAVRWERTRVPLEARPWREGEPVTLITIQREGDAYAARLTIPTTTVTVADPTSMNQHTIAATFGAEGKLLGFCAVNECSQVESCVLLSTLMETAPVLQSHYAWRNILLADATGDGLVDAWVVNHNGISVRRGRLVPNPQLDATETWSVVWGQGVRRVLAADVNGDALADLVSIRETGVDVQLSDGDSFGRALTLLAEPVQSRGVVAADLDGDGMDDLLDVQDGRVVVRRSTGTALAVPEVWATTAPHDIQSVHLSDVTNDGRFDLILVLDSGVEVMQSSGAGFLAPVLWWTGDRPGFGGFHVGDVSGDGAADLVSLTPQKAEVFLSTGQSFEPAPRSDWSVSPPIGERANYLADIDGDGFADVVTLDHSNIWAAFSDGHDFSARLAWAAGAYWGGL